MDAFNSNLQTPLLNQLKPLASITTGGSICNNGINCTSVPIHIVTQPSQLPTGFLVPSPEHQLLVGLDCEGVSLSRYGTLCIMQLAFTDAIYLVDAIEGGAALMGACKPALESKYVTKVIHDCKRDSEALYYQFGIKLNNVMDTQIAYSIIEEQEGKTIVGKDCMSFVAVLADPRYCGVSYNEKEEVRGLLKQCFCVDGNSADWPPLPTYPDELGGEQSAPEKDILSILTVPFGRMGYVIGKQGSFIRFVSQSSKHLFEINCWDFKHPYIYLISYIY